MLEGTFAIRGYGPKSGITDGVFPFTHYILYHINLQHSELVSKSTSAEPIHYEVQSSISFIARKGITTKGISKDYQDHENSLR